MRLIDADALLAEYDRIHVGEPGRARKLIEEQPTVNTDLSDYSDRLWQAAYERGKAEAAEVVQCKDCKWYKTNYSWNGKEHKVCVIEPYEPVRKEDDFCSRGERKATEDVH